MKLSVRSKLKHNNVHLIRYNCSTRLRDALYECLAKEMVFNLDLKTISALSWEMILQMVMFFPCQLL